MTAPGARPRRPEGPSRLDRVAERLGRSAGVFLAGLLVACAVEVAVDWNSTLYEINVLRAALKQKGENYADILRKASEGAMAAYDWDALDRLSGRLFDDPDVAYVRFSDLGGNTLHDRLRPEFGRELLRRWPEGFRAHYRHPMERDARGMIADPVGLQQRMAESRHRDLIQAFTDAENRLLRRFTAPPSSADPPPRTLYQDRLSDGRGGADHSLTWALGAITGESGDPHGVVLVAFDNRRVNRAVLGKLAKGLGITVFFVALILVQNVTSRRSKLRLLNLESALAAARRAVHAALPAPPRLAWGELGIATAQAEGVGGTLYDIVLQKNNVLEVLLAVPDGAGVDAAFAAMALREAYRLEGGGHALADDVARLMRAYAAAPLGRPVELLLLRLSPDGVVEGVSAGVPPPVRITDGRIDPLALGPALPVEAARLTAPLRPFSARLDGATLALWNDGLPAAARRSFTADEALARIAAAPPDRSPQAIADDVVAEAERRAHRKQSDDFVALVFRPVR